MLIICLIHANTNNIFLWFQLNALFIAYLSTSSKRTSCSQFRNQTGNRKRGWKDRGRWTRWFPSESFFVKSTETFFANFRVAIERPWVMPTLVCVSRANTSKKFGDATALAPISDPLSGRSACVRNRGFHWKLSAWLRAGTERNSVPVYFPAGATSFCRTRKTVRTAICRTRPPHPSSIAIVTSKRGKLTRTREKWWNGKEKMREGWKKEAEWTLFPFKFPTGSPF